MSPELEIIRALAEQAGEILKKYHRTNLNIEYKQDAFDPVSIADRESDDLLRAGISAAFLGDEILSEESPLRPESYDGRVWMVDPLDDTKGYLAGKDTAGVMIGLLEHGRPKLGLVYLPFRGVIYFGETGKGSFRIKNGETVRLHVSTTTQIAQSRLVGRNVLAGDIRPIDDEIAKMGFASTIAEGCIGAKVGLIAAGEADAFIHTNLKAGKWDTLAAQVILEEAGGVMSDVDGASLDYTKVESGWDRYFMAACTPTLLDEMVHFLKNTK
jgi:3'-phosphoadenosine 5'-phosphosulfate (PAPS) 3'-phosphatase